MTLTVEGFVVSSIITACITVSSKGSNIHDSLTEARGFIFDAQGNIMPCFVPFRAIFLTRKGSKQKTKRKKNSCWPRWRTKNTTMDFQKKNELKLKYYQVFQGKLDTSIVDMVLEGCSYEGMIISSMFIQKVI